ncbi:hypothetical protein EDD11_007451 [Mortierella claussenii]|nr:hypothetical protein EDD11_007451 [Mortierella claussenii]
MRANAESVNAYQKTYLESSAGADIGIAGFVKSSDATTDAVELESLWINHAIPYLMSHSLDNKVQSYFTKSEFYKEYTERSGQLSFQHENIIESNPRDHTVAMILVVSEEVQIAAGFHIEGYAHFAASGERSKEVKTLATEEELTSETDGSNSNCFPSNPLSARSSLNSIDFKFINPFGWPGNDVLSSRLHTTEVLKIKGVNMSNALMDARRSVVRRQSETSDIFELVSLNFIFDATFLQQHLERDVYVALQSTPTSTPNQDIVSNLAACLQRVTLDM